MMTKHNNIIPHNFFLLIFFYLLISIPLYIYTQSMYYNYIDSYDTIFSNYAFLIIFFIISFSYLKIIFSIEKNTHSKKIQLILVFLLFLNHLATRPIWYDFPNVSKIYFFIILAFLVISPLFIFQKIIFLEKINTLISTLNKSYIDIILLSLMIMMSINSKLEQEKFYLYCLINIFPLIIGYIFVRYTKKRYYILLITTLVIIDIIMMFLFFRGRLIWGSIW